MLRTAIHDTAHGSPRMASDEQWDAFVAAHPGGAHVQSALWSRLKASEGWKAIRIEVWDDEDLIGGAQLLIRHLPVLGSFAYVPKGPLAPDQETAAEIIGRITQVADEARVRHLTIQPPSGGDAMGELLHRSGFSRAPVPVAPTSTLVLDLAQSEEELLAGMHRTTRYNIRLASRRGMTWRVGGREDIVDFHAMLLATAERQGFTPHSQGYLETMWDVFAPGGNIVVLIVERDSIPVAGVMGIGFGDTFTDKLAGWSGLAKQDRPTHAAHWSAIEWARKAGYRFFDFEGVDPDAAQALAAGQSLPEELVHSVSSFKAGFGGVPVISPPAWHRIDHQVVGWAYDWYTHLENGSRLAEYLSNQIRRGRHR